MPKENNTRCDNEVRLPQDTQPLIQAELESYSALLADIRAMIKQAQGRAYQAVDNIRVQTYWQIGERIVRAELEHQDRAEYGQEVIKRLAVDLSISERNLYNAVAFYRAYPILQTVSAELSWSHYVSLTQLSDREERRFYEVQAISIHTVDLEFYHRGLQCIVF